VSFCDAVRGLELGDEHPAAASTTADAAATATSRLITALTLLEGSPWRLAAVRWQAIRRSADRDGHARTVGNFYATQD
jgi:hypothetical protein